MNNEEIEILEDKNTTIETNNKKNYKQYLSVWLLFILSLVSLVYMYFNIK